MGVLVCCLLILSCRTEKRPLNYTTSYPRRQSHYNLALILKTSVDEGNKEVKSRFVSVLYKVQFHDDVLRGRGGGNATGHSYTQN
jgi:hypothetical protein